MKLPLDLECPVEGWKRKKIFEYVTTVAQDGTTLNKTPVMIYVWVDAKGEAYLNGETSAYLDCIKANLMGLIKCDGCQFEASCDTKMANQCLHEATTEKGVKC